jgi:hypothetical protein
MSQYLQLLIQIAQEMPGLQYDIEHASTPLAMMPLMGKLCQNVTLILHHVIIDSVERGGAVVQRPAAAPAAPAPQAAPPPPRHTVPVPTPIAQSLPPHLPPQRPVSLPYLPPPVPLASPALPAPPSVVADIPAAPGTVNVVITPQGTSVTTPQGVQSRLPPGAPVPLELAADLPAEPPPAPDGTVQVILPRGGAMPPDVLAALSSRSTDAPPAPATDQSLPKE